MGTSPDSRPAPVGYQKRVPAVERTIRVLRTLGEARGGLTLAEVARATHITPSSLLAILNTLRRDALVRRTEPDSRYFAGPGLVALGEAAAQRTAAAQAFDLVANSLVRRTGETVLLWLPAEGDVYYLLAAAREGPQSLRYVPVPGARFETSMRITAQSGLLDAALEGDVWQVAVPLAPPGAMVHSSPALLAVAGPTSRVRQDQSIRVALREAAEMLLGETAADSPASITAGPIARPELDTFLLRGHVANLSYLSGDGYPATVPLWYHWDGANFWFLPSPGAEWPAHVQRQPRVSLAISESEAPLRRVLARGSAEVVADADGRLRTEARAHMAERYAARDADRFLDRQAREGGTLLRLTPERLLTWRGLLHHPRLGTPSPVTGTAPVARRRRRRKESA